MLEMITKQKKNHKPHSTVINSNIIWDKKCFVVGVGAEGSFDAEADKSV